jgi:hypothetical protein
MWKPNRREEKSNAFSFKYGIWKEQWKIPLTVQGKTAYSHVTQISGQITGHVEISENILENYNSFRVGKQTANLFRIETRYHDV